MSHTVRSYAGAQQPAFAQAVALGAIALVPLIPRPTFGGWVAAVAPAVAALVFYFAVVHSLSLRSVRVVPVGSLYLVALGTALYGARVIWAVEDDELLFLGSRILFILTIVACCVVFSGDTFERGVRWFIYATLVLAAVVLYVGLTGAHLLEPALPGRTLGIQVPFFKTAGVPRSFGEQGVVLAIMLAYLLSYRRFLHRWLRWLLGLSCVTLVIMAQSRNVLLCAVAVPIMWWVVSHGRWVLVRIGLVLAGTATFVMEQLLPLLQETRVGQALVGQGIFERNVEARFSLVGGALSMITEDPLRALIGWSHAEWREASPVEIEAGVHNHFVSSILFLGLIGGALTIWALYVYPLRTVLNDLERMAPESLAARRRRFAITAMTGALICVNFYEGFFSLALAMLIGILWMLVMDARRDAPDRSRAAYKPPPLGAQGRQ